MKFFEIFDEANYGVCAGPDVSFGVYSAAVAKALREFADSVEKGDAIIQSVRELSIAKIDDYPTTSVRIVFTDTKIGTNRATRTSPEVAKAIEKEMEASGQLTYES